MNEDQEITISVKNLRRIIAQSMVIGNGIDFEIPSNVGYAAEKTNRILLEAIDGNTCYQWDFFDDNSKTRTKNIVAAHKILLERIKELNKVMKKEGWNV